MRTQTLLRFGTATTQVKFRKFKLTKEQCSEENGAKIVRVEMKIVRE